MVYYKKILICVLRAERAGSVISVGTSGMIKRPSVWESSLTEAGEGGREGER